MVPPSGVEGGVQMPCTDPGAVTQRSPTVQQSAETLQAPPEGEHFMPILPHLRIPIASGMQAWLSQQSAEFEQVSPDLRQAVMP